MKRIIAVLVSLIMLTGLTACSDNGDTGRSRRRSHEATEIKVDIEDLKTYDGPMLEITSTIRMPVPDDVDPNSTSVLNYDGTVYNSYNPNECLGTLSDEDYMTVYRFCVETVENDTFADYYEEVCDGQTYRFVFYDEEGEEHVLYDGYIYQNDELSSIVDIFYGS